MCIFPAKVIFANFFWICSPKSSKKKIFEASVQHLSLRDHTWPQGDSEEWKQYWKTDLLLISTLFPSVILSKDAASTDISPAKRLSFRYCILHVFHFAVASNIKYNEIILGNSKNKIDNINRIFILYNQQQKTYPQG